MANCQRRVFPIQVLGADFNQLAKGMRLRNNHALLKKPFDVKFNRLTY